MEVDLRNVEKILIMDLLYLGDLLFATPFIRNLRNNFPGVEIDLVANASFSNIVDNNPNLDHVYSYDKSWGIKQSWNFAANIVKNDYDLGLNIHGNWRTILLMSIINPDYNIGVGEERGKGLFLDHKLLPVKGKHMVNVYLDFLKQLDLKVSSNKKTELIVKKEARKTLQEEILPEEIINRKDKKLIGLNTGGSWPTKRWYKSHFARLADKILTNSDHQVVFFGGPGDVDRVNNIIAKMETTPFNTAGKTSIDELAALAEECDLVISGDSGPVHVAAAVETPTITLFGPSDEKKYRPFGENHQIIKREMECRPCGEHECPLGHHDCMKKLKPEEVYKIIEESGELNA